MADSPRNTHVQRSRARRLQDNNFPGPGYPGYPTDPAVIRPADPAPQAAPPSSPSSPIQTPAANASEPQGYRARKLAELDAKFSNGEIAMEDYMKQRGDIMNG
ncbi:hypothetical protein IRJ34_07050 [Paenarthrobacter sp. GOM3]|uniref:hypothetical protein n=1 Tax=Paenarthrobacter sp. GOM3 TaxID=2782567 RepID=UPI002011E5E9|nr:hypothetical protein [Paenarthrobacter sp. GOM3]WOH20074.1 hypothetical protein IRJ34_07050 [Paenarthrobacter sp. GOM3]